ncbi:MAG: tRNA (guanosine(37)-N1)-methyltransferase TrmD [Patescibacteria group bacterium]
MQFDILTIFPAIFSSFLKESIFKKAQEKKQVKVNLHDFRRFAAGRHRTVDDKPYGGGPGMILKVEPLYACLKTIKRKKKTKVIILSAKGKMYDQKIAQRLSREEQLIFLCGRYEGIDERIKKFADLELSLGPYVTMGGEVAAMVMMESIARLIPGVLGKHISLEEESYSQNLKYLEYPQYTRPPVFKGAKVPAVLLSGDHKKIKGWRDKSAKTII